MKKPTYKELEREIDCRIFNKVIKGIMVFLVIILLFLLVDRIINLQQENEMLKEKLNGSEIWTLKIFCENEDERYLVEKDYTNFSEYKYSLEFTQNNLKIVEKEFGEGCEVLNG